MSTSIMFDTLKYTKKAREVGFTEEQAEFQAEEIAKLIDEKLATKQDLKYQTLQITVIFGSMLTIAVGILAVLIHWPK